MTYFVDPKVELTQTERERVATLVSEMRRRGLAVPMDLYKKLNPKHSVKLDESGYHLKLTAGRSGDSRYHPTEKHASFIADECRFSAIFGGRGSGKSSAGAQKAVRKILAGESGAVMNPDMENFKISTWVEFKEWLPWELVVPQHQYMKANSWQPRQPFMIAFVNGARVYCKGLKDPDSARGPNINWLWYDEAGRDPNGESWQIAVASVRVGKDPQCWATTTPKGKNWLYRFFIKKEIPEDALEVFKEMGMDVPVSYYFASIHENKDNLDPGFYASVLASYPSGWLRRQEVYGEFVDEGGVLGDTTWFDGQIVNSIEDCGMEQVKRRVRYWDLAASQKKIAGKKRNDPDETVGTLMNWDGKNKFVIEDQRCGYWEWEAIKQNVVDTARRDGSGVKIYVEEEPGSGGKNQVAELHSHVRTVLGMDYKVIGHNPRKYGDKVMRANIWFAEAAQKFFWMVRGAWTEKTMDQLGSFSGDENEHDDRIDSISGARLVIAPLKIWKKIKFIKL